MPLKIIRNDITKMQTEAIVNTANNYPTVGTGCDYAIYKAAGHEELLAYRKEHIGYVPEGQAFVTPGFGLDCRYIIHAVSPHFIDGESGEEVLLRSCYQNALKIAADQKITSIAFPLISTGGFGYPKEEGFRIAVDEINAFLLNHDMLVYIVVFGHESTSLGRRISLDLESYIDENYVDDRIKEEYPSSYYNKRNRYRNNTIGRPIEEPAEEAAPKALAYPGRTSFDADASMMFEEAAPIKEKKSLFSKRKKTPKKEEFNMDDYDTYHPKMESALEERMKHLSDTFSEYLMYLIESRGMTAPEVYKHAAVDKKVFSKIKNNKDAHPKKMTAMCLCVGAKLNLDQTKDLLARAGYALSPSDKTDVIFSFFIENEIYDIIELDLQLESYGLPCLIS